jgi:hypothetical protein
MYILTEPKPGYKPALNDLTFIGNSWIHDFIPTIDAKVAIQDQSLLKPGEFIVKLLLA